MELHKERCLHDLEHMHQTSRNVLQEEPLSFYTCCPAADSLIGLVLASLHDRPLFQGRLSDSAFGFLISEES